MEQDTPEVSGVISGKVAAFGVSYALTSVFSALLVVLKESSAAVHGALAAITGHHWVTHGLLDILVFVVLGAVLSRAGGGLRMAGGTLVITVVGATVLSGLIIAGYFL